MLDTFRPLLDAATGVDLTHAPLAREELERRFDSHGPRAVALASELKSLLEAGRIAERGAFPVRYGRVAKAGPESSQFSIDVVLMNGVGPRHRHPQGEVNFCVAIDGTPRFDGEPPGWVVFPPDSAHAPTVDGGTMLIVYLLPEGRIEFER